MCSWMTLWQLLFKKKSWIGGHTLLHRDASPSAHSAGIVEVNDEGAATEGESRDMAPPPPQRTGDGRKGGPSTLSFCVYAECRPLSLKCFSKKQNHRPFSRRLCGKTICRRERSEFRHSIYCIRNLRTSNLVGFAIDGVN